MNPEIPNVFNVPNIGISNFTMVLLLFAGFILLMIIMLLWMMFKKRI